VIRPTTARLGRTAAAFTAVAALVVPFTPGSALAAAPAVTPSAPQAVASVPGHDAPASAPRALDQASRAALRPTPIPVSWPSPGSAEVVVDARPAGVRAEVVGHTQDAVLLKLRRADGSSGTNRITVDYSGFRGAHGGDWASRLRLTRADGTPLASRNDPATGTVTADVALTSTDATFAVTAAPSGSTGDYSATPLSPSAKWQVSANTGTFAWSYGLRVPPVPGRLAPDLSLTYSSDAADGRVASTNNQPSWVGEGWHLGVGSVERSYKPCADDLGGNNGQTKTGDLCWETDNATLSLGGSSGELVPAGGNLWRPKTDDGSRVEHLTGAANGAAGDYWKVTTTDGTQYFFGQRTDSAWNVPVYGNDTNEPCNTATFAASRCTQTWRWNLDYVLDVHGNTISYFYNTETNSYAANLGAATVSYTRGGTLARAEYGTRAGAAQNPPARVVFDTADRCLAGAACSTHSAANWPDTPWDQGCTAAPCTGKYSPTFWSTKRLTTVTTYAGGTAVDSWSFDQQFPNPGDGTSAALWLHGITHTGLVGGSTALPAVTFGGTAYPNRVNSAADGLPPLDKYRITSIDNESGGTINVDYADPDCTAGTRPAADTNTLRCFPVRWAFPPATQPVDDWFHKYVVRQVSQVDNVGGTLRQLTAYTYVGGAAWHYDDNPLIPPDKRTWSEYRGYEKVLVTSGDPAAEPDRPQAQVRYQHFRGMNGDRLAGGGTKSVSITDSAGASIADDEPYAGFLREEITYDGAGGAVVTGSIHTPWKRGPTATQGTLAAYQVENARTVTRTALSAGGFRSTDVQRTFDVYGNPLTVNDLGGPGAEDDRCTTSTYALNPTSWLVSLPSRVTTVGVACGGTPSFPADAISDVRTYYDGGGLGAAPGAGDVSKTEKVASYSGSTPSYVTASRATYDAYGRVLDSFDALDHKTTTAYTETAGLTTSTVQTNALGHATTSTIEPAWGLPVAKVDANARRTDTTYDPLGRLTAVWLPGRVKGSDGPNTRYTYGMTGTAASWVRAETLKATGSLVASYTLFDGFLRTRQTQAPSSQAGTGRVLTDTLYDSRGLTYLTREAYFNNAAAPGTTLFLPDANQVPSATKVLFDGAKRPVVSAFLKLNVEQWRTTTAYGGDHTDVTPPTGDTPTRTDVDARGQTTALRQLSDVTTYTYTKAGLLASVTDPAGNAWRYGYDVRGRRTSADDPDKGHTDLVYDDLDQPVSTTDARGGTVVTEYDDLGRKVRTGTGGGTTLATWTYDTLAKGALTSSTRFYGTDAYTRQVTGYDAAGRPEGEQVVVPASETGLAGTYPMTMTYRADGSPSSTALPQLGDLPAETVNYGYSPLGLPSSLTGAATYLGSTTYTALNEPSQVALGATGKRVWQSTYYEEGTRRVSRLLTEREVTGSSAVDDLSYVYDPAGNVTRQAQTLAGTAADTQCFGYDALRRTTAAWTPASGDCAAAPSASGLGGPAPYWQSFSYDVTGNRLSSTVDGVTTTYTYPPPGSPRPHAVLSAGASTYGYDEAGNVTDRSGQPLAWSPDGLLSSAGGTSYVYDADGTLLLRRDPGATTLFVGGGELRRTSGGALRGTRYYGAVALRTAAGVSWLTSDRHGTALVAVNAASLVATPRRVDLFGVPRGSSAPWPGGERSFVGGSAEDSTGLTRLGAREYDPRLGRFLSVDPVIDPDDPQQLNAYAYANSNPPSMSDPDGLKYYVDADGLVTMPSLAHATPAVLKNVQAKLNKLAPMYAARERARLAHNRAVSRAAQHDWNGVDGKRGRVGGYNSRPLLPWANRPPVVMHRDNSFGAQLDRTINSVVGGVSSATAWGIRQTVGRALDPFTETFHATIGFCVGGTAAAFAMTVGGSACYIQAPDGSAALTLSASSAAGPGLGATVGAGPFISNAQTVDDVGGPFIHTEASAAFVGGIAGSFDIGSNSKGDTIWTATVMPSLGAEASLGAGISTTWVLPHWYTPGK
jgi:RHS repeat-associated protein